MALRLFLLLCKDLGNSLKLLKLILVDFCSALQCIFLFFFFPISFSSMGHAGRGRRGVIPMKLACERLKVSNSHMDVQILTYYMVNTKCEHKNTKDSIFIL